MQTIRFFLLALLVVFFGLLSCSKSELTPASANSTSRSQSGISATGTHDDDDDDNDDDDDDDDNDDDDNDGCGKKDCIYTQGGYGAPNGKPRDYMYANFYKAFPNGFPVGSYGRTKCDDGKRVFMSSPEAVTATLPVGGTPAVLTKNYRDKAPKNVLVGQLIALCLNLGLEPYCPTFDAATMTPLTDMIICKGPFAGMTVNAFFKLAGDVLGGCNTSYSPSTVNETASKINENYENGGNNGFLKCP